MFRQILMMIGASYLVGATVACTPTASQQSSAFLPTSTALQTRAKQSRRFETTDQTLMLQAAIGALQDLGFTIEESQSRHGVIVASKLSGGRIRAQVVVAPMQAQPATVVRVTFQRSIARPGAMLAIGESLDEPELYQGFFEKLAHSAFLTAHEI